eukprot:TRINITY_DN49112_c0_g1_i3.p1 TRINITY_DN49112_c0_g1~~TRINITY_DN49112_c0_g1_i3.p1  ORF type:complete len:262 (-),score=61.88 TRINITY_DN49112_c0_g1_i3:38-823(-)
MYNRRHGHGQCHVSLGMLQSVQYSGEFEHGTKACCEKEATAHELVTTDNGNVLPVCIVWFCRPPEWKSNKIRHLEQPTRRQWKHHLKRKIENANNNIQRTKQSLATLDHKINNLTQRATQLSEDAQNAEDSEKQKIWGQVEVLNNEIEVLEMEEEGQKVVVGQQTDALEKLLKHQQIMEDMLKETSEEDNKHQLEQAKHELTKQAHNANQQLEKARQQWNLAENAHSKAVAKKEKTAADKQEVNDEIHAISLARSCSLVLA